VGKRKDTKETEAAGANHDHHGPWWCPWPGRGALWLPGFGASRTLCFGVCLELRVLPWIIHLGPIGLVLLALLTLLGLIFMLFS